MSKIKWSKCQHCHPPLLLPSLILSRCHLSWPWFFESQSFSFQHLTDRASWYAAVSSSLEKQIVDELLKVLQQICNSAITCRATCSRKKNLLRFSLRYQPSSCFVFLINEHLIANFASFIFARVCWCA